MLVLPPQAAVAASESVLRRTSAQHYGEAERRGRVAALPQRTGSVYHWVMAERAMPPQSPSRYAAVAALFAAIEELMDDYRSLPDADHVRRWSEDADRITGEVARHLAAARARISAAPPHDAR
jgi:hypothetical protein